MTVKISPIYGVQAALVLFFPEGAHDKDQVDSKELGQKYVKISVTPVTPSNCGWPEVCVGDERTHVLAGGASMELEGRASCEVEAIEVCMSRGEVGKTADGTQCGRDEVIGRRVLALGEHVPSSE